MPAGANVAACVAYVWACTPARATPPDHGQAVVEGWNVEHSWGREGEGGKRERNRKIVKAYRGWYTARWSRWSWRCRWFSQSPWHKRKSPSEHTREEGLVDRQTVFLMSCFFGTRFFFLTWTCAVAMCLRHAAIAAPQGDAAVAADGGEPSLAPSVGLQGQHHEFIGHQRGSCQNPVFR